MPLTIVLVEPEIPPNTGNIARLCAATNTNLHIVGTPGFDLSDKAVKRAGLDYWHLVNVSLYPDIHTYFQDLPPTSLHLLTTKSDTPYWDVKYQPNDYLVFGPETRGLSEDLRTQYQNQTRIIPMSNTNKGMRSINLATATGIVLFEALRQQNQAMIK